jgi:hypothetical protein
MQESRVAISDDFATGDQCEFLIASFDDLARSSYTSGVRRLTSRTEISAVAMREANAEAFELISAIRVKVHQFVKAAFDVSQPLYIDFTLLSAMGAGDRHPMHADREMQRADGSWGPNHTPHREYAGILYLNSMDRQFSGGMLSFGDLGEEIGPVTGRLVAFGCSRRYTHEVSPVSEGTRYSLSCWLTCFPSMAERWAS